MIRTFQALQTIELGFTHAEHLQTVRISIPASLVPEPERVVRMQNDLVDKLRAIPGVTSVAFASAMPMEGLDAASDGIYAEDKPYSAGEIPPLRMYKYVSPGFFQAAGTKMLAGRDFTWTDLYGRRPVAVVSEKLAREVWGLPSAAIGKRIRPEALWQEVIGVVQDVRNNGAAEPAPPLVYWPSINQVYKGEVDVARAVTFAIRSGRTGNESFLKEVRQAVWSVDSNLPVASVRTMQEVYEKSLARTSFTLVMLGIAGVMALLLGVVGIYGVISYSVSQRTREIGIRLALGAPRQEVTAMFVRHGLVLSGIGVAYGLTAAFALTRVMKSLLFNVSSADPLTYLVVSVGLIVAAVVASYLPARRAAKVDPMVALRYE